MNSFVRFLEESLAWQYAFEINWPLVAKKCVLCPITWLPTHQALQKISTSAYVQVNIYEIDADVFLNHRLPFFQQLIKSDLFIPYLFFVLVDKSYKKTKLLRNSLFVFYYFSFSFCLSCLANGKHHTENHATYFHFW